VNHLIGIIILILKGQLVAIRNKEYKWYALYTKSRVEKKLAELLQREKIETYLPLIKKLKQWSDRKKWVEEPLFRSYVFVRISEKEYYTVLNLPGVVKYVSFEGIAASVPDWQIDALNKIVSGKMTYELSSDHFKKGDFITITSGALKGISGEIIEQRGNKKFLIRIEPIGYSILLNLQEETGIINEK
jgi:transcriptional antiterminator RfaH